MADESVKISLFPTLPMIGVPPRLAWNCSLLTTAQVSYGVKYANENFQIPMEDLRSDFTGYIGIKNVRPVWTDIIKVWRGKWWGERESSEGTTIPDRANSYTYVWDDSWIGYQDYMPFDQKFKENGLYFLTEAPIPLEEPIRCDTGEQALDPATFTTKIVSKDYVDARHNGFRKLTNEGNTLAIRPYTCYYNLTGFDKVVDITDGHMTEDIKKNRLTFYVEVGVDELAKGGLSFTVNGEKKNFRECYGSSLNGVLSQALSRGEKSIIIEMAAETIEDEFVVSLISSENSTVVNTKSAYGDIQDNIYTFSSRMKESSDHGVDVFLDSTATTVVKRLIYKDGTLQVQRGGEIKTESANYLFSVDDECHANSYSFRVGASSFRDEGEHNKMRRFCVSGTLYHIVNHLEVNGSYIGVCSNEPTVQEEYEEVIFRVVDEEAEDERLKVDIQDGLLTFTTQTRKEMFGTEDILVYHRHGQWEDKEVQTLDITKFVQSPAIVVRELPEVVVLSDLPKATFTVNLDRDKSAVLDMSGLRQDAEYIWRIYVKTGEYVGEKSFELAAWEDGEEIEIQWVND